MRDDEVTSDDTTIPCLILNEVVYTANAVYLSVSRIVAVPQQISDDFCNNLSTLKCARCHVVGRPPSCFGLRTCCVRSDSGTNESCVLIANATEHCSGSDCELFVGTMDVFFSDFVVVFTAQRPLFPNSPWFAIMRYSTVFDSRFGS